MLSMQPQAFTPTPPSRPNQTTLVCTAAWTDLHRRQGACAQRDLSLL